MIDCGVFMMVKMLSMRLIQLFFWFCGLITLKVVIVWGDIIFESVTMEKSVVLYYRFALRKTGMCGCVLFWLCSCVHISLSSYSYVTTMLCLQFFLTPHVFIFMLFKHLCIGITDKDAIGSHLRYILFGGRLKSVLTEDSFR